MQVLLCCKIFTVLTFISIIEDSESVKVTSVGLASGLPYARNSSLAYFSFNVSLEPNEELKSVLWTKNEEPGRFEWTKEGEQRSGSFNGINTTSVKNGEFKIDEVNLSDAGNYTVKVVTNLGSDAATFKFIVQYDGGSSVSFGTQLLPKCLWNLDINVYKVAPYPNISCVFEGDSSKVPLDALASIQTNITDNNDGSYTFTMIGKIPIKEIPIESYLACNDSILGSQIFILKMKSSSVSGQPCPEPNEVENYIYKLKSGEESCHGGYTQHTEFNYTCANDPDMPGKTIKCKDHGRWVQNDETSWPNCKNARNKVSLSSDFSGSPLGIASNGRPNYLAMMEFLVLQSVFIILNKFILN